MTRMQHVIKLAVLLVTLLLAGSSVGAVDDSLGIYLQLGGSAITAGDYTAARGYLESALRLDPASYNAHRSLGLVYSALGRNELAKSHLLAAHQINPDDDGVNNNLGVIYSQEGNTAEALKHFEAAIAADSSVASYWSNLAREQARNKRLGPAIDAARRSVALDSLNDGALYTLATSFAELRAVDSAEIYFERSLKAGVRSPEAYYFLGTVERDQGKFNEAEEHMRQALKLRPDFRNCRQDLGLVLIRAQKTNEAIDVFNELIEGETSPNPRLMIALALAHSLEDHYQQADSLLKELFAIDSTYGFQLLQMITAERQRRQAGEKAP